MKEWNLTSKLVGFGADNCNTNFGGPKRNGQNNIFYHLQQSLGRKLFGLGCTCHITHNAFDAACDKIPVEIETTVVKIYKHFHIFTVRVENLKEFCENADVEFTMLTNHCSTRFLSLQPAVSKVIQMFEPLKSFFRQADGCPDTVAKFFADKDSIFWLHFVENQLELSNEYVRKMESRNDASFAIAEMIETLLKKLENRKVLKFLPTKAREYFNKCVPRKQDELRQSVNVFYETIVSYLKVWSAALDGSECLSWMSLNQPLSWEKISVSVDYVLSKLGDKVQSKIDRKFL